MTSTLRPIALRCRERTDALDVLNVGGAQEEAGDGSGQAEGAQHLCHRFSPVGYGRPQGGVAADAPGNLEGRLSSPGRCDPPGQFSGAVVSAGDDCGIHAPVVDGSGARKQIKTQPKTVAIS